MAPVRGGLEHAEERHEGDSEIPEEPRPIGVQGDSQAGRCTGVPGEAIRVPGVRAEEGAWGSRAVRQDLQDGVRHDHLLPELQGQAGDQGP